MENLNQQDQIFTNNQIQDFVGLFNAIRKVHCRLVSEGYLIEAEQIIKPKK